MSDRRRRNAEGGSSASHLRRDGLCGRTRHGLALKNLELIPFRSLDDHTVKHQCQIVQQRMEVKLREEVDRFAAGTEVKRKEFALQSKIALETVDSKPQQALRSRSSDFRHVKVQDHFATIINKTHTGLQDRLAGVTHKPDAKRKEIRRHRFNVNSLEAELVRVAQMARENDMRIKKRQRRLFVITASPRKLFPWCQNSVRSTTNTTLS